MSSRHRQQNLLSTSTDWLRPHRERFLKSIVDQGYCNGALAHFRGVVGKFCKEVARRGLPEEQLAPAALAEICVAVLARRRGGRST